MIVFRVQVSSEWLNSVQERALAVSAESAFCVPLTSWPEHPSEPGPVCLLLRLIARDKRNRCPFPFRNAFP